jgi:hypothetical protein
MRALGRQERSYFTLQANRTCLAHNLLVFFHFITVVHGPTQVIRGMPSLWDSLNNPDSALFWSQDSKNQIRKMVKFGKIFKILKVKYSKMFKSEKFSNFENGQTF